jgi:hypothetical protein
MRILLTEVGNASPGDEAITLAAAKRLSGFGHELTVAYRTSLADSFRRAGMSAEHVHVPIAPVGPHYATAKALLAAVQAQQPQIVEQLAGMGTGVDAVCVVPGGKFLDGFDNSLKFLTIALARRMGIPYLILHQSVGPLTNRNELDLLQEVFRDAALVVARDHKSFEFLTSLGLSHHRLVLGADAAMPENYPESQSKPYALGVNLRWSALGHSTAAGLRGLLGRFRDFDPQSRVLIYSTTTSLPPEVLSVAGEFGCEHDSQWCRFPDYLQQVPPSVCKPTCGVGSCRGCAEAEANTWTFSQVWPRSRRPAPWRKSYLRFLGLPNIAKSSCGGRRPFLALAGLARKKAGNLSTRP